MKFLARTGLVFSGKNLFIAHILSFIYVLTLGYFFLVYEYSHEKYFYFYFRPYQSLLKNLPSLWVIPGYFWIFILCFTCLLFFCKVKRDFKPLLRQTILSSFIIYLYILLLTLQADTKDGAFFWPLHPVHFPFKSMYAQTMILFSFFAFYLFLINAVMNKNSSLGYLAIPLLYLPLVPFIYQYSPWVHSVLLFFAALFLYFLSKSRFNFKFLVNFFTDKRLLYLLPAIFAVACLFRLLLLNYLTHIEGTLSVDSGKGFLNNAIIFSNGEFPAGTAMTLPYSYLLSLMLKVAGSDFKYALTFQVFLCALIPILVFYISRIIFDFKVAFLAAICSALSSHLIYYSAVVHKSIMAAFFLTLSILILIKIINKGPLYLALFFGFCFGWTVLLDGMLAPLFLLVLIPLFDSRRNFNITKYLAIVILGFVIAQTSFNWIVYKNLGTVLPMGREAGVLKGQWNYADHEEGNILEDMGYEPFIAPMESLKVVINHPMEALGLLLKKSFKEFQSYFLDHESFYLEPVLFNRETYFSSSLSFYYFPVLFFGFLAFFLSKKINWKYKLVLGSPIVYTVLFFSFFWLGTNRYRVVTQPLILILFAYGLKILYEFFSQRQPSKDIKEAEFTDVNPEEKPSLKDNHANNLIPYRIGFLITFLLMSTFLFTYIKTLNETYAPFSYKNSLKPANYRFSPWITEKGEVDPRLLNHGMLMTEIILTETNYYDLGIKFATTFGPTVYDNKLAFSMNDTMLEMVTLPRQPGWIILKNVKMEKGLQKLVVRNLVSFKNSENSKEKASQLFSIDEPGFFGNVFKFKSIKLIDFRMVKSN